MFFMSWKKQNSLRKIMPNIPKEGNINKRLSSKSSKVLLSNKRNLWWSPSPTSWSKILIKSFKHNNSKTISLQTLSHSQNSCNNTSTTLIQSFYNGNTFISTLTFSITESKKRKSNGNKSKNKMSLKLIKNFTTPSELEFTA